jgi:hypothetical protein
MGRIYLVFVSSMFGNLYQSKVYRYSRRFPRVLLLDLRTRSRCALRYQQSWWRGISITRTSSRLDFSRLDYPSPLDCTRTLLSVCPLSGSILRQIDQVRFKFQVRGSDERRGVTTRLVRGSIASIGMLIFPLLVLPDVLTPFVCLDCNISAIVD